MQKVYLLLRQQQQTGPYSYNDLKSLELTESDLLWDTSKDSGWSYPFELGLPFSLSPIAETKKKEVDPIIKKITEPSAQKQSPVVINSAAKELSIDDLSDRITQLREKIKLVEQQLQVDVPAAGSKHHFVGKFKNRKKSQKGILFGFITFLILVIVLVLFEFFTASRQKVHAKKPVTEIVTPVEKPLAEPSNETARQSATDTTYTINYVPVEDSATAVNVKAGKKYIHPVIHRKIRKSEVLVKRAIIEEPVAKKELAPPANLDYVHKQTEVNFINADDKKKNVFKKIGGVFKRKDDLSNNSAHPEQDLLESIAVNISTTHYKWLKGVQGLTVILNNNSDRRIVRAQIDILFFNDQNCIIERDTKVFTNVAAAKSQAIAVSDRPYASHAGYQVVSITATKK
jgi:hypothetical protein